MEFRTFVNPNKWTVAVKVVDAADEFEKEFIDFHCKHNLVTDWKLWRDFINKYRRELNDMTGIATCNVEAGDVFDSRIGEQIARERCLKKFERIRHEMYIMIASKPREVIETALKRMYTAAERHIYRRKKIAKLATRKN